MKKKKILVMPDGNWLAHTTRPFEIAKHLRRMGHKVVFAGEGYYMNLPRAERFEVLPAKTKDSSRVLNCARSGRVNWYDREIIEDLVGAETELINEQKPDLVLTDFRLTLSTTCELLQVPLAVTINAAWTNYYSAVHRAPEHIRFGRLFGRRMPFWVVDKIKQYIITEDSKPFRAFRESRGLKPNNNIWDVWEGDINLLTDIPEYSPTENLPDNFHYIGPIFWEPKMRAPEWLIDIKPDVPAIYITMGSTGNPKVFEEAVEIFGGSPYQFMMTTAGMIELVNVPSNFRVVNYAPGSKLLEKSNMVICQGGNGTIYQSMSKGVPVIGIPTMHDQEYNLDRVEALGMGLQLSEYHYKPLDMVEAVEKLLRDYQYKQNAMKYKAVLETYDGPTKGAEIINDYLK